MSSDSINVILKLYVSEQEYLPFSSPERGCVYRVGSKGLMESFRSASSYAFLRSGFFFRSFFARLRKAFSSSSLIVIIRGIEDRLHRLFNRVAYYRIMLLLGFQHSLHKGVMFLLPFKKKAYKISDFLQTIFRQLIKHLVNLGNFHRLHIKILNRKYLIVNNLKQSKGISQ